MGLKVSRCLPSFVLFVVLAVQLPVNAQSVPCSAITRNPLVLEALLDSHSKDTGSGLQDDTINAAQLGRLQFSPIVIQPGDALYLEYRGKDFVINADFASGDRTEFNASPKGSYEQWRKGILPLDMFRVVLSQRFTGLRATAKNPNQVLFRNIKIIRAGRPVFESARLATYGRTQLKMAAKRELPCKGVDEYPNTDAALTQANLSVPAKRMSKSPLTLTAQEVNSMYLDDSPVIQAGDFMVFEFNRRDFVFHLLLSNGKQIVSRPLSKEDAEDTSVAWRKGRIRLDYPEALNQRIIRQAVVPLHEGGTPLLLRGMKLDGNRKLIFELEKSQPGTAKTKRIEPPTSYPPDAHVMTASATTGNFWGHQPDAGFLAPRLPTLSMNPMMFQSTTDTSDPNHFKFNGKELDAETGLYNYGARYYSPGLGRFMTPDWSAKPVPVPFANLRDPQTLNLYGYARNNPISLADLDGHAVQLSDDEQKRKQQLAAAQQAVGKQAGKYLYDNVDKNGHHYIGILKGGPTGKGPDFKNLNGAANKLNGIIQDSRIATVVTVSPGTNVAGPDLSPNGLIGSTTSGMTPGGSRPVSQMGGNEVVYLTSGDPGKLTHDLSSTNRDAPITLGDVLSHELGHVFARWFGGDSNTSSVQMENQTRRLNGEPTRTGHGARGDVQP